MWVRITICKGHTREQNSSITTPQVNVYLNTVLNFKALAQSDVQGYRVAIAKRQTSIAGYTEL